MVTATEHDTEGPKVSEQAYDDTVLVRRRAPIGEVVLNRPEKLNALGMQTSHAIRQAFRDLEAEEDIKVIIFRGNGRAFSTGGDMSRVGTQYSDEGLKVKPPQRRRLHRDENGAFGTWEAIAYNNKVVIAEGKGYVLGVSLDFFVAADIIVCAEGTLLGYPPARMIAHTGVSTAFWMLRMGPALHSEITFMGRYITAEDAWRHGLVNRVVPLDQLEATVEAAADSVCNLPADGLVIGKYNKKVALDLLGARTSGLQSSMGHALAVQQKMEPGEWNLVKERDEHGTKGSFQRRDERFKDAARRYDPDGPVM